MPWGPRTKWRDRPGVAAGFRGKMLDAAHGLHPTGVGTRVCAPPLRLCCAHLKGRLEGENMRDKSLSICLLVLCFGLTLAGCNSRPNVSGVWKGSVQASEPNGKNKWNGPAELTLNQNGDALTGTLSFTYPQAGRIQIPITSAVVSKDAITFSGQQQFPLGGSAEITVHGTVKGGSLNGTMDMTSRGLFGTVTNSGPMTLTKQ